MSLQGEFIKDYVIPMATAVPSDGGIRIERFLGTAFLIGRRGFALTAAHTLVECGEARVVSMFSPPSGGWTGIDVIDRELHASEDVAILRLAGNNWRSFLRISPTREHSALRYHLFGYPSDVAWENAAEGRVLLRPDLIYNEGYIRRRISSEIPMLRGRSFYELSEIAGAGCSGAPIAKITGGVWNVTGIYVGEKTNDRATSVSYAVRSDAFYDWVPACLGRSILDEANDVVAEQSGT